MIPPSTTHHSNSNFFDITTQSNFTLPPSHPPSNYYRKEVNTEFQDQEEAYCWTEANYQYSQPIQFKNRPSHISQRIHRASGQKWYSTEEQSQNGFSDSYSLISNTSSLSTEEHPYCTPTSSLAPSRATSVDSFEESDYNLNSKQIYLSCSQMPIPFHQLPHSQSQKQQHSSNSRSQTNTNQRDTNVQTMGLQQRSNSPSSVHSGGQNSTYSGGNPSNHNQSKCRQLPCRTFISTGSCPYGDRCVFLHDPRIMSKPIYIRCKRKSKEDVCVDAFYWPTMPMDAVLGMLDGRNMPHISQPYVVPVPSGFNNGNNDLAVYSMYEHFMDALKADSLSIVTFPRTTSHTQDPLAVKNPYTGRDRLPIFRQLSNSTESHSATGDEISMNTYHSAQYSGNDWHPQYYQSTPVNLQEVQPLDSPLMSQLGEKTDSAFMKMPHLAMPPPCSTVTTVGGDVGKFQRMP